jgi:hypothetical protein
MSKLNLNWYIKKYGEEEGKRRFDNRKNTVNTMEWYINNFGEEEGKRRYDDKNKNIGKSSVGKNSLKGFIKRYGEINGKIKYEEFVNKSKHTKEKYIKEFGENIGKDKWENYVDKKKLTSKRSIDYWLNLFDGDYDLALKNLKSYQSRGEDFYVNLYGEDEGKHKWDDRDKHILSRDNFIIKYGEDIGNKKWEEHLKNRKNFRTTYNDFISKYGEDEGKQKWKEHIFKIIKIDPTYSKVSQLFFDDIYNLLDDNMKNNIYYGSLNKEYFIYDEDSKKIFYYDYVMNDIKLIIEFNGDYWHANPNIYVDDFYHTIRKMTAKDIWTAQQYKNKLAENNGYQVIEIWESDYRKDKNYIKNYCLDVIKNKYKKI